MADLFELVARLGQATAANQCLDLDMLAAVGPRYARSDIPQGFMAIQVEGDVRDDGGPNWVSLRDYRPFTRSLDAARELFPEPTGHGYQVSWRDGDGCYLAQIGAHAAFGATEALALCAAALKFRIAHPSNRLPSLAEGPSELTSTLASAAGDVVAHLSSWNSLLHQLLEQSPPKHDSMEPYDDGGHGLIQHEIEALQRDGGALARAIGARDPFLPVAYAATPQIEPLAHRTGL